MKLDSDSIKQLIGESKDVIVYGFTDCAYTAVFIALRECQYQVCHQEINTITYDETNGKIGDRWKALLTSLVVENYKRELLKQPLVYLIFCVAYEDEHTSKFINISQVASSRSQRSPVSSITDKELRRSFKLYNETTPEIKKIVQKSFKFVKVKKNLEKGDYQLEEVKPFWEEANWEKMWEARKQTSQPEIKAKKYPWKTLLSQQVNQLQNSALLFKPHVNNSNTLTSISDDLGHERQCKR